MAKDLQVGEMEPTEYPPGFGFLTFGDLEMHIAGDPLQVPVMSVPGMLPPISTPTTAARIISTAGSVLPAANPSMASNSPSMASDSSIMPPPSTRTFWAPPGNEGESFNDSGYFSPQTPHFTALQSRLPASGGNQAGMSYSQTPPKVSVTKAGTQVSTPRSSWHEDFPNISDSEWDSNFINTFSEEALFGIDAADLNNMVDGILGSPASPFRSPRNNRSAAQGLALSPLNNLSAANVMLPDLKTSPAQLGGSPLKHLFNTPSPVKGFSSYTRTSPMTRQRRRILQSPPQGPEGLSDNFLDVPSFPGISNEAGRSDLGVMPFQRTNSIGFTPTERLSPPFSFEEHLIQSGPPFAGHENLMPASQIVTAAPTQPEMNSRARPKQHKKIKMGSLYNLRSSPAKKDMKSHKQQSPSSRKSPARHTQGRISVTRHSHLVDKLDAKGALRFVRARFKEVLEKAVADADKNMRFKLKACSKEQQQQQPPEMPPALVQPVVDSTTESVANVPRYTQIQSHPPPARRRQEILPKPTPDWPQRPPCKIAPKKRKR